MVTELPQSRMIRQKMEGQMICLESAGIKSRRGASQVAQW